MLQDICTKSKRKLEVHMTIQTYRGVQHNSSVLPKTKKVLKGIYRGVEWKTQSEKSETTADKELSYRGLRYKS
ncbi:MAG: DUF4278 domain-containing protein [Gammaproteobacteria bacterium TMED225]|nr:MAG: DUF4278 domain-containing protein [Gammaproteobacteria bacterium TMED225]